MAFGRRLAVAIVTVPALVLGGCADDPRPEPAPPSETATTGSPSPSATPTTRPWEKRTDAGAVAFAKHWIAVFNEAQRTGDTTVMRRLSAGTCGSCARFADTVQELYSDGGRIESKGWRVLQVAEPRRRSHSGASVALRVKQSRQLVHRADGSIDRFPGGKVAFEADLSWTSTSWAMAELVLLG